VSTTFYRHQSHFSATAFAEPDWVLLSVCPAWGPRAGPTWGRTPKAKSDNTRRGWVCQPRDPRRAPRPGCLTYGRSTERVLTRVGELPAPCQLPSPGTKEPHRHRPFGSADWSSVSSEPATRLLVPRRVAYAHASLDARDAADDHARGNRRARAIVSGDTRRVANAMPVSGTPRGSAQAYVLRPYWGLPLGFAVNRQVGPLIEPNEFFATTRQ